MGDVSIINARSALALADATCEGFVEEIGDMKDCIRHAIIILEGHGLEEEKRVDIAINILKEIVEWHEDGETEEMPF